MNIGCCNPLVFLVDGLGIVVVAGAGFFFARAIYRSLQRDFPSLR